MTTNILELENDKKIIIKGVGIPLKYTIDIYDPNHMMKYQKLANLGLNVIIRPKKNDEAVAPLPEYFVDNITKVYKLINQFSNGFISHHNQQHRKHKIDFINTFDKIMNSTSVIDVDTFMARINAENNLLKEQLNQKIKELQEKYDNYPIRATGQERQHKIETKDELDELIKKRLHCIENNCYLICNENFIKKILG